MYIKVGLINAATMGVTFLSGAIVFSKLPPNEFITYMFIQTVVYIVNEALCLGGNIESLKEELRNNDLEKVNRQQIINRCIISFTAFLPIYYIVQSEVKWEISILLSLGPLFYASSPANLTRENGLETTTKINLLVAVTGLILRMTNESTFEIFTKILALEIIAKGILYIISYKSGKPIKHLAAPPQININIKQRYNTQIFGIGLISQLIANRMESIVFKGNEDPSVALSILCAAPLISVYYTLEMVKNRTSEPKPTEETVEGKLKKFGILIIILLTITSTSGILKNLTSQELIKAIILSSTVAIDGIYYCNKVLSTNALEYIAISAGRLFSLVTLYYLGSFYLDPGMLILTTHMSSIFTTMMIEKLIRKCKPCKS